MLALLQRTTSASVNINKQVYSQINEGLVIFLGIENEDSMEDINYLINKIFNLRIFNDNNDKINLSITDIKGDILIISQFTLLANTKKGRRPSFIQSAKPPLAEKLYNIFVSELNKSDLIIKTGQFGAMMDVELINSGPATFILNGKS